MTKPLKQEPKPRIARAIGTTLCYSVGGVGVGLLGVNWLVMINPNAQDQPTFTPSYVGFYLLCTAASAFLLMTGRYFWRGERKSTLVSFGLALFCAISSIGWFVLCAVIQGLLDSLTV